jgi:sulfite reductase (ferredoxin)
VLGCPTAGVDAAEYIDATPYVLAVGQRLTGTKEFSNLPRKYKISITGCADRCGHEDVNDIGAVAHRVNDRVGFDVMVGGGLSTTPHMAQSLGALVAPDELTEVCVAITSAFRDYGYRRTRNRARLKFLVADWGVEKFREVLEKKYLKRRLTDGPPAPTTSAAHRDHAGIHRQADGNMYLGFPMVAGRTDADQLSAVAEISRKYGKGRVRTTTQQKMLILDIPENKVEEAVSRLSAVGFQVRSSSFRRSTMACTGIEFCKLAVAETKARASNIVDELEARLPDFEDYCRININGCPNSCARFQIADVGFMGSIVTIAGEPIEVFQVYLGGHLGEERHFARLAKGARVRADKMTDYVESMLRLYLQRRLPEQDFSRFLNQLDDEGLQEFAREAMPPGALVEAGTSEGGSAHTVREAGEHDDTAYARAQRAARAKTQK